MNNADGSVSFNRLAEFRIRLKTLRIRRVHSAPIYPIITDVTPSRTILTFSFTHPNTMNGNQLVCIQGQRAALWRPPIEIESRPGHERGRSWIPHHQRILEWVSCVASIFFSIRTHLKRSNSHAMDWHSWIGRLVDVYAILRGRCPFQSGHPTADRESVGHNSSESNAGRCNVGQCRQETAMDRSYWIRKPLRWTCERGIIFNPSFVIVLLSTYSLFSTSARSFHNAVFTRNCSVV